VREMEGALQAAHTAFGAAASASLIEQQDLLGRLDTKTMEADQLLRETHDLRAVNAEAARSLDRLQAEVERLNGLLEMIYRSKTWKMHTTIEKLRGRG